MTLHTYILLSTSLSLEGQAEQWVGAAEGAVGWVSNGFWAEDLALLDCRWNWS